MDLFKDDLNLAWITYEPDYNEDFPFLMHVIEKTDPCYIDEDENECHKEITCVMDLEELTIFSNKLNEFLREHAK